jgi:hypothetical protein
MTQLAGAVDDDATFAGYAGPAPPTASLVVLHQHNYGSWRADVDGQPLQAVPADGFGSGWIVGSSAKQLRIYYAAPPIQLLWIIAAATFVVAAALAGWRLGRHSS